MANQPEPKMERLIVALDSAPNSLKSIHYLARILVPSVNLHMTLFHVIPTTSPDMLKEDELRHIERLHGQEPHLTGYFWKQEDEDRMKATFLEARRLLTTAGFDPSRINTRFAVQYDDVAQVIVKEAKSLRCSTVVVGRRGMGRVKEFLLGSVSSSVTRLARGMTVWVVDY